MKLFAAATAALLLTACTTARPLPHRDPATSWDQANLKMADHGCPTAIFVAPSGTLTQCEAVEGTTSPASKLKYFTTANAAALYAVGKIYEHSHHYEYGGLVLKAPDGFVITQPHTQRHGTDVDLDEDPESYDFTIVATYHVHPCLKDVIPSVFSPQDLAGARTTNHPAYVLDECTGALHYWAPGDGYMNLEALLKLGVTPAELKRGGGIQLSAGKIVGHIKVDGVLLN